MKRATVNRRGYKYIRRVCPWYQDIVFDRNCGNIIKGLCKKIRWKYKGYPVYTEKLLVKWMCVEFVSTKNGRIYLYFVPGIKYSYILKDIHLYFVPRSNLEFKKKLVRNLRTVIEIQYGTS